MTNKTYNQYCAIACALDVVGERWSLLLVRNLCSGPKRYSDLLKGMPGISTNILTNRLKALEANEVITTRYLPAPAASSVYDLTARGQALIPALSALAQWGASSMGAPEAKQRIVPDSVSFMLLGVFWRAAYPAITLACAVHVHDERFDQQYGVALSPQGFALEDTPPPVPDVHLTLALEPLMKLSSGYLTLQVALDNRQVTLTGSAQSRAALLRWCSAAAES